MIIENEMKKYDDIVATANELLSAIKSKDKEQMAAKRQKEKEE